MRWTRSLVGLLALLLPADAILAQGGTGRIVGTVTDPSGNPLPGANITLVGTRIGTLTGEDGRYAIQGLQPGTYTVRASLIGHTESQQQVSVTAGGTATANFQLQPAAIQLTEIVAIGYGTVRRSDLTGSVATIRQEELRKVPTSNVTEALQGKMPGVDITRGGGSPNSGVNLRVRGTRSLTASNAPLVIIDGVQFGSLQDLNPNDIESIQILKDASATAIYGSRGANGVILVTTKSGGAANRAAITINSYVGVTEVKSYPRINTGPEYVALKREANRTVGIWNSPADDPKIFTSDQLANIANGIWTDFRELLFHRGTMQSHQVGISAGSERTRAYLSLSAYDEQGILRKDELKRYVLRFNLEHALGDRLKVGTNSQITHYDRDRRRNPLNMANKINPLVAAYDADGSLIIYPGGAISPLADEQPNAFADNELETLIRPSVYAELSLIDGLTFRSNLAARRAPGVGSLRRRTRSIAAARRLRPATGPTTGVT